MQQLRKQGKENNIMNTNSLLLSLLFFVSITSAVQRPSSAPYVSGDSFRACADFIIDFKIYGHPDRDEIDRYGGPFMPDKVQCGDVIFVNNEFLSYFFEKYHQRIPQPYILLTHNGDYNLPGKYAHYLDDPKIIAWFGDMVIEGHSKLHPIPVGIANNYWPHGNLTVINRLRSQLSKIPKNKILYLNIGVHTNPHVRSEVISLFAPQPFCSYSLNNKPWEQYLYDLASSQFVLSPRGNGIDCHRTWEALLMGSFPIVKRSALDSMFEDLPVVIVDDWHEITLEFLVQKYKELVSQPHNFNKLFLTYWTNEIEKVKSQYK
jgi:hypothetical protein